MTRPEGEQRAGLLASSVSHDETHPGGAVSGPPAQPITVERDGHVLLIGLNRPAKRNAFTLAMLGELSAAYGLLERDDDLRCGVLFAHGEHFTGGLDMVDVGPSLRTGTSPYPEGGGDPWRVTRDLGGPGGSGCPGRSAGATRCAGS